MRARRAIRIMVTLFRRRGVVVAAVLDGRDVPMDGTDLGEHAFPEPGEHAENEKREEEPLHGRQRASVPSGFKRKSPPRWRSGG